MGLGIHKFLAKNAEVFGQGSMEWLCPIPLVMFLSWIPTQATNEGQKPRPPPGEAMTGLWDVASIQTITAGEGRSNAIVTGSGAIDCEIEKEREGTSADWPCAI